MTGPHVLKQVKLVTAERKRNRGRIITHKVRWTNEWKRFENHLKVTQGVRTRRKV